MKIFDINILVEYFFRYRNFLIADFVKDRPMEEKRRAPALMYYAQLYLFLGSLDKKLQGLSYGDITMNNLAVSPLYNVDLRPLDVSNFTHFVKIVDYPLSFQSISGVIWKQYKLKIFLERTSLKVNFIAKVARVTYNNIFSIVNQVMSKAPLQKQFIVFLEFLNLYDFQYKVVESCFNECQILACKKLLIAA
jgi:hypothetical protein